MNLITSYISNFISRKGSYVFLATIFARIFSFLAAWFALKLIPNKELGEVLFAYNIIIFILPISGLGLHQSFIRYGALLKTTEEKNSLFLYVFKKGFWVSLVLIAIISVSAFFIDFQFSNTKTYLILLSFIIIPSFLLEIIKAQLRLSHNNKSFAYTEIAQSIILLITVIILSYYFAEFGYAIALLLSPLLTALLFINKININFKLKTKLPITDATFWKYGFFASLSNVVTQLLFVIDILLIGYLLADTEMVTNYRYISLIPFSLLFLPRVFIATDFVAFTEKIYDNMYIKKYMKSYMLLFLIVSIFLMFLSYFFGEFILKLLDEKFVEYSTTFFILMVGISGIFMFRGLYGNLLSSIGKAHINYYIATIALLLNIVSNYYLIPKYGIRGAAITSALLMWFTGIASYVWFLYLYKKLPLK
ncbi:hypothetical protein FDT66_10275 [Polaribacter aestuariivivens]|uniref:Uncharacterized protein n=1 Tax=Polaribacter aestuariivivens TaxID=2304626 RepID=A0A5S3N2E7_9FLAO|nr:polysaccharide biosynthesis C-terminal domain-containing protein [Polaribacter aestuariivivens]TMM29501.1 hypothetical protein FDT66_10275 [Polaribacter aestuariivivens]